MKISDIQIRAESPHDYPKVYNINTQAFGGADEANLVDKLRSGKTFIGDLSLVASIADVLVGHLLLSSITIADGDTRNESLALAPVAVLPEYQLKGVGTALIRAGLARAKELGHKSVIVLGHDSYYPRFGFVPANKWNIKAPFNVPTTSFMAIELEKGALKNIRGVVEYPKDFDTV